MGSYNNVWQMMFRKYITFEKQFFAECKTTWQVHELAKKNRIHSPRPYTY
jgi:hypothetical protein